RAAPNAASARDRIEGSGRSRSVGESTRLISAGSAVRVRPPAPFARQVGPLPAAPALPALMQPLLDRIRQTIRRHGLADARTRAVVAVSGGSDSVALAHLARELAAAGDLQIAGIAHFNHQLRLEADADQR